MMDGASVDALPVGQDVLRGLAGDLIEASKPGEAVFLTMGNRLEEAIGITNGVATGLEELSAATDGDDVRTAADGLRQAATEVVGMVTGLDHERAILEGLAKASGGGTRAIGQLQKTIGEIGILGINAKIQLAQISGVSDDFAKFTGEITRLALLASDDLHRLEKGHAEIRHLIDQARGGLGAFAQAHGQALVEIGEHLQKSLDLLDIQHRQNREAVQATARRSTEVAGLVGQAVISLQINDMTRQRIEHVAEALTKAADLVGEKRDHPEEGTESQQLAAIICRLQSIHLAKTAEQFETEVSSLLANLGVLADKAEAMVKDQMALAQAEDGDTSLFQKLSDQLREACVLYRKISEARSETQQLIGAISDGVSRMISSVVAVHEIEADIRIMGLNATLRCSRLGSKGLALAVIAQELRRCANRTQEQAKTVEGMLEALVDEAKGLGKSDGGGDDGAAAVVETMTSSLALLQHVEDAFERRCAPMLREAERAKALLAEAAGQTEIPGVLGSRLRGIGDTLENMARIANTPEHDERRLSETALRLLDARYTMASEQHIHNLFLGVLDEDLAPADPSPDAAPEADDFLF